jgi:hypothetical protein
MAKWGQAAVSRIWKPESEPRAASHLILRNLTALMYGLVRTVHPQMPPPGWAFGSRFLVAGLRISGIRLFKSLSFEPDREPGD